MVCGATGHPCHRGTRMWCRSDSRWHVLIGGAPSRGCATSLRLWSAARQWNDRPLLLRLTSDQPCEMTVTGVSPGRHDSRGNSKGSSRPLTPGNVFATIGSTPLARNSGQREDLILHCQDSPYRGTRVVGVMTLGFGSTGKTCLTHTSLRAWVRRGLPAPGWQARLNGLFKRTTDSPRRPQTHISARGSPGRQRHDRAVASAESCAASLVWPRVCGYPTLAIPAVEAGPRMFKVLSRAAVRLENPCSEVTFLPHHGYVKTRFRRAALAQLCGAPTSYGPSFRVGVWSG